MEITTDLADIVQALEAIDILEVSRSYSIQCYQFFILFNLLKLSKDRLKVRRKTPVNYNKDVDAATVYVENLPKDATIESISAALRPYGVVEFVTLQIHWGQ